MAAEMSDQKEPATLQVSGDEVKMEIPQTREIDIHDRDPLGMVQHVKVGAGSGGGEASPSHGYRPKCCQMLNLQC